MFNQYACINECNVCVYIFMDVTFECRYICMHACICMYVCMDGWMDRWMDVCMKECMYICYSKFEYCLHYNIFFTISLKYLIFHGLM